MMAKAEHEVAVTASVIEQAKIQAQVLVPLVKAVGIDTVHFGIVVTVNLAIGLFHPPFGMNIFVAQSVLGLPLKVIYRGIIPFLAIYLLALVLITYIPAISLIGVRLLLQGS